MIWPGVLLCVVSMWCNFSVNVGELMVSKVPVRREVKRWWFQVIQWLYQNWPHFCHSSSQNWPHFHVTVVSFLQWATQEWKWLLAVLIIDTMAQQVDWAQPISLLIVDVQCSNHLGCRFHCLAVYQPIMHPLVWHKILPS